MANRRAFAWFDHMASFQVASGASLSSDLSNDLTAADKRGCTVTRILATIHVRPTLIDLGQLFTFGFAMIHEDQVDRPDPEVSTDQPSWLLRDQVRVIMSDLEDGSQIRRLNYDLSAQRKFPGPSHVLRGMWQNNAGGGSAVEVDVLTRVLCRMG